MVVGAYVNVCDVFSDGRCPLFFFFNDTATTEIYTLSLHDALPISPGMKSGNCNMNYNLAPRLISLTHHYEPGYEVV